jgi:hypothetical protein
MYLGNSENVIHTQNFRISPFRETVDAEGLRVAMIRDNSEDKSAHHKNTDASLFEEHLASATVWARSGV